MKKKYNYHEGIVLGIGSIMQHAMRYSAVLLLCLLLNNGLMAQSKPTTFTFNLEKVDFEQVIKKLQGKSDFTFLYNHEEINKLEKVSVNLEKGSIEDVLTQALAGSKLGFKIHEDIIIISPKVASPQLPIEISGKITDKEGYELLGASVLEVGTSNGVTSNENGTFTLKVKNINAVIRVSFVGFETQHILVGKQTHFQIVLEPSASDLSEVVVTGYQTLSKERVTGSFVQLNEDDFNQRNTIDLKSRLEGMTAGLYISKDKEISIRGIGTLYGESKPLVVVDGFPVEADINTINPDDIKSVTVLKDAAASSIWGVRASNGVIVITTKMGKLNSNLEINASYYISIDSKPNFNDLHLAPTDVVVDLELDKIDAGFWRTSYIDYGYYYPYNLVQEAYYEKSKGLISDTDFNKRIAKLKSNNAYKEMQGLFLRNALRHQFNVSLSGGGKHNRFFSSLTYNGNKLSSVGNDQDQLNINIRNEYGLSERFKLSTSANLTYNKNTNNGFSPNGLAANQPFQAILDEEGNPMQYYMVNSILGKEREEMGYLSYRRSLVDVLNYNDNTSRSFNARLQLGLSYKLGKGFDFDTKFQYERGYLKNRDFKEALHPDTRLRINTYTLVDGNGKLQHQVPLGGILRESKNDLEAWTWRNQLNFDRSWNNYKHQLSAIAGMEVRKYVTYSFYDEKMGYDPQSLKYVPISEKEWLSDMQSRAWYGHSGAGYPPLSGYSENDNRDVSFYLNASYSFNKVYTLTMSGRVDQSNLFGNNTKYRYNPLWSAGFSWKLSEENFLSNIQWLNDLTLRMTYGTGGNTNKNFYPTLIGQQDVSYSTGLPFIKLINPSNPDLKWETSKTFNMGVNFSILNNRLWGSLDYYLRASKDIIGRKSLDATYGWSSANLNFAAIDNKGIELSLNALPVKSSEFIWETNLNLSYNKNEVKNVSIEGVSTYNYLENLSSLDIFNNFSLNGLTDNAGIPIIGKPISRVYAYKWGGLNEQGMPMLYNEDNELVSAAQFEDKKENLKYMGTSTPRYYGNFRNRFSYKGLALTVNMTFKFGHVFRAPRSMVNSSQTPRFDNLSDRWLSEGDESSKDFPALNPTMQSSIEKYYLNADIHVLKGDFIRLSDIALDYELPKKIISKLPFSSFNIKVQLRNLWLWTANNENWDPDAIVTGYRINSYSFPSPKTIVFGVKATF